MRKEFLFGLVPLLVSAAFAAAPSIASAGSGDFCQSCEMTNGKYRFGSVRPYWLEVESWNSNDKGQASCAGVGYGPEKPEFEADRCSSESKEGYKEAYCIERCHGQVYLIAMMVDDSGFTSYFTGWEDWSESAGALGDSPGATAPPGSSSNMPQTTSVTTPTVAHFAVFDRPQVASDAIPSDASGVFSRASGANPSLARRVQGEQGMESWIIPGNGSVCIQTRLAADGINGANCAPLSVAEHGELGGSSATKRLPGAELVSGVMPDGITSVTLTLLNGQTVVAPVRENVYQVVIHGNVTATTAVEANGSVINVVDEPAASAGAREFAGVMP